MNKNQNEEEPRLLIYFRKLYKWPNKLAIGLLRLKNFFYLFLWVLVMMTITITLFMITFIPLLFFLAIIHSHKWLHAQHFDPPRWRDFLFYLTLITSIAFFILITPLLPVILLAIPLAYLSDYLTGSHYATYLGRIKYIKVLRPTNHFPWEVYEECQECQDLIKWIALGPKIRFLLFLLWKVSAYGIPLAWFFSGLISLAAPYPIAVLATAALAIYLLTEAYADNASGGLAQAKRSLFFDQLQLTEENLPKYLLEGISYFFRGVSIIQDIPVNTNNSIHKNLKTIANGDIEGIILNERKKERFNDTSNLMNNLKPGLGLSHILGLGVGIYLSVGLIPLILPSIITMGIPWSIAVFSACMFGVILYKLSKDFLLLLLQLPFDIATLLSHFKYNKLLYCMKFIAFTASICLTALLFPIIMTILTPLALSPVMSILIAILLASLPLSIVNHLSERWLAPPTPRDSSECQQFHEKRIKSQPKNFTSQSDADQSYAAFIDEIVSIAPLVTIEKHGNNYFSSRKALLQKPTNRLIIQVMPKELAPTISRSLAANTLLFRNTIAHLKAATIVDLVFEFVSDESESKETLLDQKSIR